MAPGRRQPLGEDERVRKVCELLFDLAQDRESGGFAYRSASASRNRSGGSRSTGSCSSGPGPSGGDGNCLLPCFTGNMVFALVRLGYLKDRRVQAGIDWITRYQRFDDGDGAPQKGWPYERYDKCWGKHTCYYGVVKSLKALSEIPEEQRSHAVKDTAGRCADYLLKHRVFRSSRDPTRIGYPLMWKTDALEVLLLLARLGLRDGRMKDAVDLVVSKRGPEGRWDLDKSFSGRFQVPVERAGRPSKWVTLRALTVLKLLGGVACRGTRAR